MKPDCALELYEKLAQTIQGKVLAKEPMSRHSYFKIGGPAALFVEPEGPEDLKQVLLSIRKYKANYYIIGNGTNLLCSDKGFDGVIVKVGVGFDCCDIDDNMIKAGSGMLLSVLAQRAMDKGLTGLEFASGIPGYLGGAICMNAGAYGGEMKDIVKSVSCMDLEGGEHEFSAADMNFAYRHTALSEGGFIVTNAVLSLKKGDRETIKARMSQLNEQRTTKQPLNMPSAGSTFKRPSVGYASKLIEDAGLKGMIYRGAMVSDKHSGFIINRGDATCKDVMELMRIVISTVKDKFDITLEPEVKIIGTAL